jgi:hypothetical protein
MAGYALRGFVVGIPISFDASQCHRGNRIDYDFLFADDNGGLDRVVGFHCAHLCDNAFGSFPGGRKRTVDYVVTKLRSLVNVIVSSEEDTDTESHRSAES